MTRQSKRRLEKLERKHAQAAQAVSEVGTTAAPPAMAGDGTMDARSRSLYMLLQAQHEGDLLQHKRGLALGHILKLFARAVADSMGNVTKQLICRWRDTSRRSFRLLDDEMLGLERSQLFAYKVHAGFHKCDSIFQAHRVWAVTGAMQQWILATQAQHTTKIQEQAMRAFSELKRKEKLNSLSAQAEKHAGENAALQREIKQLQEVNRSLEEEIEDWASRMMSPNQQAR